MYRHPPVPITWEILRLRFAPRNDTEDESLRPKPTHSVSKYACHCEAEGRGNPFPLHFAKGETSLAKQTSLRQQLHCEATSPKTYQPLHRTQNLRPCHPD